MIHNKGTPNTSQESVKESLLCLNSGVYSSNRFHGTFRARRIPFQCWQKNKHTGSELILIVPWVFDRLNSCLSSKEFCCLFLLFTQKCNIFPKSPLLLPEVIRINPAATSIFIPPNNNRVSCMCRPTLTLGFFDFFLHLLSLFCLINDTHVPFSLNFGVLRNVTD